MDALVDCVAGLLAADGKAVVRDVMQSRNLDCAVRRDWKDVLRCVSSASSCVLRSRSCGTGNWARSTGGGVVSYWTGGRMGGMYFDRLVVAVRGIWMTLWVCGGRCMQCVSV